MKKNRTMLEMANLFSEEHPLTQIKEAFDLAQSARNLVAIANKALSLKPEFSEGRIDAETFAQVVALARANAAAATSTVDALRLLEAVAVLDEDTQPTAVSEEDEARQDAAVDAAWRFARCVMNDRAVGGPTEEQ